MIATILREEPDAIFIAGDLYDGTAIDAGRAAEPLNQLTAPHGVYFVAGNHEQFGDDSKYLRAIAAAGVRVLNNEVVEARFWKTRRRILWKRIRQERKRWKQVGANSFYLFSAFSASSRNSIFLAFGGFFVSKSVSAILPFGDSCLQLNYLVQLFNSLPKIMIWEKF